MDRYKDYRSTYATSSPYIVILGGRTIVRYSSQMPAALAAIKLRRDGCGMAYVEKE